MYGKEIGLLRLLLSKMWLQTAHINWSPTMKVCLPIITKIMKSLFLKYSMEVHSLMITYGYLMILTQKILRLHKEQVEVGTGMLPMAHQGVNLDNGHQLKTW